MTRKSRRELERALADLDDSPNDGIGTVTFREWRADETGEPVECIRETEYDLNTGGTREIEIVETIVPTDWERKQ